MKLKIGKEKIRISHNEYNRLWKPVGMFSNIAEIKIDNEWYKCSLRFIEREFKNYIQITHPMKVDEKTLRILDVYKEGIYKELRISKFKMNFIKYRLNQHPLNFKIYYLKRALYERMNSIIIFSTALLLSAVFYLVNIKFNNILINFIAQNLWCQTIIIFLTLASFINIFYPFSLRKELNKRDVVDISNDTFEKKKEEEKINAEIKRRATI